jgi:CheY-like chemotaxis protein
MSRKRTILIIDDHKTFVMYAGILIRRMGFEVMTAANGLEAFRIMKRTRPDLILLTTDMADSHGFSVLEDLLKDRELATIPVVLVSLDPAAAVGGKFASFGCAGFLQKPLTIEQLNRTLYDILSFSGGKRQFLRITLNEKVVVTHAVKKEQLFAVTLSEGGIFLRKRDPFPVGAEVTIELPVYDKIFRIRGSVIYVREAFQNDYSVDPGVAVRFHQMQEDDAFVLRHYITERLAGDLIEGQEEPVLRSELIRKDQS